MKSLYVSKANLIAYTLGFVSLCVLFTTFYLLANIKVLESWSLTLPSQKIHVGDTVVIQSTYNKVRDTSGESVRYITCKNSGGIWIRYELNRATSNRAKGKGGTGISLTIRRDIADVPTTCKFEIAIRYDGVLPFKDVFVNNSTKTFTLYPEERPSVSSSTGSEVTTQSSQSPIASDNRARSSSNNTPTTTVPQSNTPQPSTSTTTNTTNNTTTNTPTTAPEEQACVVSVLGLKLLC